jgi:hypothetical protein
MLRTCAERVRIVRKTTRSDSLAQVIKARLSGEAKPSDDEDDETRDDEDDGAGETRGEVGATSQQAKVRRPSLRASNTWVSDLFTAIALPWTLTGPDRPNTEVNGLLGTLRAMPAQNDFILEEDREYVTEEVNHLFVWLRDELVAAWYQKLHMHQLAQEAFSALINHLHEWAIFCQAEGCFLTLSYLVRVQHSNHDCAETLG